MVPLSLFCFSAFTWSASSGASIVHNINAYTEESPTKSIRGFVWKESNRIPEGKKDRTPKIYRGRDALVGEFPWMASIHWDKQGFQCGGTIISRKHVLTAAHCLPTPTQDETMTVLVGGHFQDESLEPRAQRIAVKKAVAYSDYKWLPLKHDIAILVLKKEIELNNYTGIIDLPSRENLYGDFNAIATGWGNTFGDPPYVQHYKGDPTAAAPSPANPEFYKVSPVLKATSLTIFSNNECNMLHEVHVNYQLDNYMLCAGASKASSEFYMTGYELPGDTKPGDSGGPLVIKENEKWVLVGITSSTHSTAAHPLPGIYTRVTEYLSWIKVQMNQD